MSFISTASCVPFGPHHDEFGIPEATSYNPELHLSKLDVHSMYDRLVNQYARFLNRLTFGQFRSSMDSLFRQTYGADFPSVTALSSNSAYVFVNSEPFIDFATPTVNKVIPIGGIGAKDPTKLSETVKALPDFTFIWKYGEEDEFTQNIASKVTNLELTKWMPQSDLLAHPRLSVFITHGGMGSTQETALRGTPEIFIPLFGDQPRKAGMMEHNKLGKVFDKRDLTNSKKFAAVVREVIEDDTYRENSERISAMLHKKPFNVKDQIVKYTEFAAEFGASRALRPQSHDMNFIEYHNLDIILVGIIISLGFIAVSLTCVRFLVRKILIKSKEKTN